MVGNFSGLRKLGPGIVDFVARIKGDLVMSASVAYFLVVAQ